MSKCERCGKAPSGYTLFDYCAHCSKNLCDDCMTKGCCGHVPAVSGMDEQDDPCHGPEDTTCPSCGLGGVYR
jgi:hypothetical protein